MAKRFDLRKCLEPSELQTNWHASHWQEVAAEPVPESAEAQEASRLERAQTEQCRRPKEGNPPDFPRHQGKLEILSIK